LHCSDETAKAAGEHAAATRADLRSASVGLPTPGPSAFVRPLLRGL
jgi:hypothetical protein